MKKIIILAMFLILMATNIIADNIQVNLVNYQPTPVTAGNYFIINFQAINNGLTNLTNLDFELQSNNDFSVSGDNQISIDSLLPRESTSLSWTVLAKENAKSGFRPIKLDVDGSEESYLIQVKSIESTVSIANIKTTPEQISPGATADISVDLENKASFNVKNLKVNLDLSAKELPFAPSDSVTEKIINGLNANSEVTLDFRIISLPEAQPGIYKVPLSLVYFDEFGNNYQTSTLLSIIVGSVPKLEVGAENPVVIAGQKSTVSIKVVNYGLSQVKFLNIISKQSSDINILSSPSAYIGDLDSDDFQTVDVDLFVTRNGQVNLPLTVTFLDANNQQFTEDVILTLNSYTKKDAEAMGLINNSNTGAIIITILVIIVLFVIYRKIRKHRKK